MKTILRGVVLACLSLLGAQWGMGPGPGLGSSAPVSPVIRGTSSGGSTSASSFTASLTSLTPPGGGGSVSAQAGDFALFCFGGAWNFASVTPAGWTQVYDEAGGICDSSCYSKTLTSGDISTGTVTMNRSNTYAGVVTLLVFVGGTGGVRESGHSNYTGGPTTQTLNTSSAVLSSDVGIAWSATRNSSGSSLTTSPGTSLQNPFFSDVEGRLYDYSMPGGVTTFSFTDTTPGANFSYGFVIVKP